MGDYDSTPMLYCSRVLSHKIPFAMGYQSQQPFYRFMQRNNNNNKKRGYDSSPLLLFARGVTAPWNFS